MEDIYHLASSDNEQQWLELYNKESTTRMFKRVIKEFFIKDKISYNTYILSREFYDYRMAGYKDFPLQRPKNSDITILFTNYGNLNDLKKIPAWFLIGYPDVQIWLFERSSNQLNSFTLELNNITNSVRHLGIEEVEFVTYKFLKGKYETDTGRSFALNKVNETKMKEIEENWNQCLNDIGNNDYELKEQQRVFVNYFALPNNIDFKQFTSNLRTLMLIKEYDSLFQIEFYIRAEDSDYKLEYSPSISLHWKYADALDLSTFPIWYYAAFPDVAGFEEATRMFLKADFTRIAGSIQDFTSPERSFNSICKYIFYCIERYKSAINKRLECEI